MTRYLRRTLYHLAVDGWRRQRAWRDRLGVLSSAAPVTAPDRTEQSGNRDQLVRLLLQIPPRQRAVIVLRCWEDSHLTKALDVLAAAGPVQFMYDGHREFWTRSSGLAVWTRDKQLGHDGQVLTDVGYSHPRPTPSSSSASGHIG